MEQITKEDLLKKIDDKINSLEEGIKEKVETPEISEINKVINEISGDDMVTNLAIRKYVKYVLPSDREEHNIEIVRNLARYDDILKEFLRHVAPAKMIKTADGEKIETLRITKTERSICEHGYTAYDILEKEPCLLPHQAYLWLGYLRDNSEKTQNILSTLEKGLPVNSATKLSYNVGRIRRYLSSKDGVNDVMVKSMIKPYFDNPDIANEFEYWIRKKEFVEKNPVTEQGYTAKRIYQEFNHVLDASGVFSLLITLRTNPEKGLKYIEDNFPRK